VNVLEQLADSPYATFVRESLWGWPISLTFHAFGNGAAIGLAIIIALRMLGFFRSIPYTSLSRLFPVIWLAVVCQVISGTSLWMTKPDKYLSAEVFDIKLGFVLIGVIITAYFQGMLRRQSAMWQVSGKASPQGVRIACLMALAWIGVLEFGRLTAYLGQLYS
jgi:hypothetical protein